MNSALLLFFAQLLLDPTAKLDSRPAVKDPAIRTERNVMAVDRLWDLLRNVPTSEQPLELAKHMVAANNAIKAASRPLTWAHAQHRVRFRLTTQTTPLVRPLTPTLSVELMIDYETHRSPVTVDHLDRWSHPEDLIWRSARTNMLTTPAQWRHYHHNHLNFWVAADDDYTSGFAALLDHHGPPEVVPPFIIGVPTTTTLVAVEVPPDATAGSLGQVRRLFTHWYHRAERPLSPIIHFVGANGTLSDSIK